MSKLGVKTTVKPELAALEAVRGNSPLPSLLLAWQKTKDNLLKTLVDIGRQGLDDHILPHLDEIIGRELVRKSHIFRDEIAQNSDLEVSFNDMAKLSFLQALRSAYENIPVTGKNNTAIADIIASFITDAVVDPNEPTDEIFIDRMVDLIKYTSSKDHTFDPNKSGVQFSDRHTKSFTFLREMATKFQAP